MILEHDLFRKPVSTFRDHALSVRLQRSRGQIRALYGSRCTFNLSRHGRRFLSIKILAIFSCSLSADQLCYYCRAWAGTIWPRRALSVGLMIFPKLDLNRLRDKARSNRHARMRLI